jgi:tetratricopeptide (TPR) repeat protein
LADRGELAEAAALLAKAAQIEPSLTAALRELAEMLMEQGHHEQAEEMLKRAVLQNANEAATHRLVGRLFAKLERTERAEAALKRASW